MIIFIERDIQINNKYMRSYDPFRRSMSRMPMLARIVI